MYVLSMAFPLSSILLMTNIHYYTNDELKIVSHLTMVCMIQFGNYCSVMIHNDAFTF